MNNLGSDFKLVLGTLPFGGAVSSRESEAIIVSAIENGLRDFDVAPLYGGGKAPRILGRAIRDYSEDVSIWGSIGLESRIDPQSVFAVQVANHTPAYLLSAIDQMLEMLDRDYIDVLNIHAFDPNTNFEQVYDFLLKMIELGKVKELSYSNLLPHEFSEIERVDIHQTISRIQLHGNLVEQRLISEFAMLFVNSSRKIVCHRPFARGLLTREYGPDNLRPIESRSTRGWRLDRYLDQSFLKAVSELRSKIENRGISATTAALTWLKEQPKIAGAIFGVRSIPQLLDVISGLNSSKTLEVSSWLQPILVDVNLIDFAHSNPQDYFEK